MTKDINVNLRGTDNASPALQSASQRLGQLRQEIDALRGKGQINLTVADARNINRLTSEANRLERGLTGVGTAGVKSANSLTTSFGGLQGVLGGLGLGGLGAMVGGAGLAALAVGAGKAVFELSQLGEMNREIGIRFGAFAGSATEAARMVDAMSKAAEGGVDDEELMSAATRLLSTELVTTAEEMGSLTRSALLLGNPLDSATSRIEAMSNVLMTGNARALKQFGVTSGEVAARVKELTASSQGLTTEQIRVAATMQIMAEKADKAAAAGASATDSTTKLRTAWGEMKDSLAEQVNASVVVTVLTNFLQRSAVSMGGGTAAQQLEWDQKRLAALQETMRIPVWVQGPGPLIAARKEASELEQEIDALNLVLGSGAPEDYGRRLLLLAGAAQRAADAARGYPNPVMSYELEQYEQRRLVYPSIPPIAPPIVPDQYQTPANAGYLAWQAREKAAREVQAGEDFRRKVEAAGDTFKSNVKDALQTTSSNVAQLWPEKQPGEPGYALSRQIREGPFAPGAEGPTEKIYQLEAVAAHNDQMWAQMLGVSQEYARGIIQQVSQGNWGPEVMKWVDTARLQEMAKGTGPGQDTAQKLLEAAGALDGSAKAIGAAAQEKAPGKAPEVSTRATITNTVNLSIAAGAVQVVSNNAGDVAGKVIDLIFKALTRAEGQLSLPAGALAPGAR